MMLLLGMALAADPGVGVEPFGEPPTPEVVESRTYALAKGMRCPVCQGLSVADSNAEAAVAMKDRIQELVAQGYTDEQITDYFVDRYGNWILLEPPAQGTNKLLFLGPPALILAGLGAWALRRKAAAKPPAAPPAPPAVDDEHKRRVLEELER